MVSVAPRPRTSGCRISSPSTPSSTPKPTDPKKATDSSLEARSSLRLPSSRDSELPPPWPKKKPMACMMVITEKATPTAPDCEVPSRPMNQVSAML